MENEINKLKREFLLAKYGSNSFESLQEIDLKNNKIINVEPNCFQGLVNLRVLNLSNNSIIELHPCLFKGLVSLKELRLDHNKLQSLET